METLLSAEEINMIRKRGGIPDGAGAEGYTYKANLHTILSNPVQYREFIERLVADNFPLKELYKELQSYYKALKDKQKPRGMDLFSYFG